MSREDRHNAGRDELLDLLAERATVGLDPAAAQRLEELLAGADEKADHFETAAAAIELAGPAAEEKLPAAVAQRLHREGRRFAAGLPRSNVSSFRPRAGEGSGDDPASRVRAAARARGRWIPWLVAAVFFMAACTGWWRVLVLSQRGGLSFPVAGPPAAAPAPTIARAALLAGRQPAATLPFKGTADPAAQGVTGDVVWSPAHQEGYLRFQNLPANDPKVQQYQLWIFDATRDDRFPIDGGVFDVPASGEVVVKVAPKLAVGQATLFAVTIEKPGGVVVSSRDRIVLVASVI